MARIALCFEFALLFAGGALLGLWGMAALHQHGFAAWDRASFARSLPQLEAPASLPPPASVELSQPRSEAVARPPVLERLIRPDAWLDPIIDTSEWSAARIGEFLAAPAPFAAERLALLEIPSIDLGVVVLDGTDEVTLNRGVGRIEGTAAPGTAGNSGIAGHRDSFFRGLARVTEGDLLRVTPPGAAGASAYRIEWIRIVRPEDVWVLAPTEQPSLTLVTCHPFHYVGNAPDRYVVRAVASQ